MINNADQNYAQQQFEIAAYDTSGGPPGSAPPSYNILDVNLTPMTCQELGTSLTSTAQQECTFTTTSPVVIATVSGSALSGIADELDYSLPLAANNFYQGATATVTESFVAVQCSNNAHDPSQINDGCAYPGPRSWS